MPENSNLSSMGDMAVQPHAISVLLVDDQLIIVEALRRMLADQTDIDFHFVTEAKDALQTAIDLQPTVILQDLVMPGSDGFKIVRQLREQPQTREVPIIVLSAKEDPRLKANAFNVGANDYVVKLPDRLELIARVRYHSSAYISRLQRDQAFQFLRESQQKLAEANVELQKLAALDGLTGIANRRRFNETLESEWQRAIREKTTLSLVMCDVDHFKLYNDTHGHPGGDLCLKKVAAVLTEHLKRPADLAARYGGEEFAIILPDTNAQGALQVAQGCRQQVAALQLPNPQARLKVATMSLGVASMAPTPGMSVDSLIALADQALYKAKDGGRNQVVLAGDD